MGSALDSASLIMYPSGYSDGVLGSAKPTDGTGDFTFTRGSNLSATRVNEQGYIEKGYENLLLQSNSFLTTWTTTNASVTGGQVGYDGTNDAWLLEKSAADAYINQGGINNGVQTFSIYAKANESNFLYIRIYSDSPRVYFDLINGVATNSGPVISSSMEDMGNGWYRCSVSANLNAASFLRIYPAEAAFDSSATSGSIYIQDAMLNQGLVAYPYIETTTAPVAGGILEDEPRIDFSDGCGHLLLEPSRTNLVPHSEYLNAIVSKSDSLEMNTADTQSPEGVYNASKFSFASGTRYIGPSVGAPNNISFSVFAKAGTHNFIQFVTSATNLFVVNFDLSDGSSNIVGTAPSELQYDAEDYGNGWYRIWFYYDNAAKGATIYCWIVDSITASRASSVSTSGDIYLYGFQAEQDATYPTSYIPTYGVSQTRLKEITDTNHIIGNTDFTIFGEFNMKRPNASDSYGRNGSLILNYRNSGYGGFLYHFIISKTLGRLRVSVKDNATINLGFFSDLYITEGVTYKYAVSYKIGVGITFFLDGQSFFVSNTDLPPLYLDLPMMWAYDGSPMESDVKKLVIFPTALSDSECIALTTI